MKKFSKIIILMIIIMSIMMQYISVLANVIEIGESSLIKRGELGFYSIQYWNEAKETWKYITYSKTYYIDKEGKQRIAYCIDPDLDGVGWLPGEASEYGVTIEDKITNEKLWRVYRNGYPFVSPEALGVETEDDAYLATKQAAYFIIRGKTEGEVYSYFRAGETEINGQSLEEIHRRGEKVVAAIYKLVEIGNNGNQKIPTDSIDKIGTFKQDNNEKYYSQEYKIISPSICTIAGIEGAPEGTYIADINGNEKTTFNEGENFKLMVLKENIDKTYNIKINIQSNLKNYPVYYAKSHNSNTQNYVVITENNETRNFSLNFTVIGNNSNVNIIKVDEDSKKPIEGVKFNIKYKDGTKIGEFVTDSDGRIKLENIKQGDIVITEMATKEEYELNLEDKEILVEYGATYDVEITNKHKKGALEILKVDKEDNNIKLDETEFDLIDSDGNVAKHLVTDENGRAYIEDVDIGEYTLKETKAKEGYKIGVEQKVKIYWNEKLSLFLENERLKGNINIIKIDKDNPDVRIAGVEFDVLDSNMEKVASVVTDENGEAEIVDMQIGKYYLKETNTDSNYVLNKELIEVIVKENEEAEAIIENEKIKGKIKVLKTSSRYNEITHEEAGTPIKDVKFGVYDENKNYIQEIVTDEKGEAVTDRLVKGIYYIKEIETDKWYIIDENYYKVEIKNQGEIVNIDIKNQPKEPEVDVEKSGPEIATVNQEIKYDFEIKNSGNVEVSNFTWYDFLPYEKACITKLSTGTYNQDINYSIYYKTNKKLEYIILEKNLNSKINHYIDLSNIYLEDGERITQIKVEFGVVDIGFSQEDKPCIYMKVNENLEDNTSLINETILEGIHNGYKVCDEDSQTTIIQNKKEIIKKLPRTGF